MIKIFIFDFDGTLADTSQLIVSTMQKTVKDFGLPFRDEDQIKSTIGLRLEEIPGILWPDLKNIGESFVSGYRKNFEEVKNNIPVKLFPGVKETLSNLKVNGYKMAIATSRSHKSVEELTKTFHINEFFDCLVGGDDVSEGKPNPESIFKISDLMDWDIHEIIMVGDMAVDILMGKNAGVKTCGVTYGNGKILELEEAGADFIIPSFHSMPEILNKSI